MWEALTSNNGIAILIALVLITALVIIGAKHGYIKIKTDKFAIIGETRGNERLVMQKQLAWLYDAVFAFEHKIPHFDGYNEFKGRYILSTLYIDISDWIMNNHIEESQRYIKIKQSEIWNKTQTLVEKDELKTARFKSIVDEYVKYIIHNLVLIRKEYEK